ncbi:hypothetical protein [Rhabdothermincola salaria]|uniref:hypothetical protein n=1 Tax=Rhabdothermincola salaria TaxID=2903142 RepID=UPI001E5DDE69|nr:hypothetical protein [Rhabdothermincola salaria]MCD9624234.1 hypothetical protein [Rhabdothermincola salaria]
MRKIAELIDGLFKPTEVLPQRENPYADAILAASTASAVALAVLSDAPAKDKAALFVTPFISEAAAAYGAMKGAEHHTSSQEERS